MQSTDPARRLDLLRSARAIWAVRVPAVVWFLGLTSFLTDISSEMVLSALPGFLVLHLGVTPFTYGVIDGLYHGLTSVARLLSGVLADRTRRYKEVAFVGYAVSAVCKLLLVIAPGPAAIGGIVAADRLGKGIRTAPRDALVGLSVDRSKLGSAFGVHRALDTAGAALGPFCAFLVLARTADGYDVVFMVSFAFALAGLAALGLFVRNPSPGVGDVPTRHAGVGFRSLLARPDYRAILVAASALSLATISDGFLYLIVDVNRPGRDGTLIPLFFTLTAVGYFVLAIPFGLAADRFGRVPVFVAGHVFLIAAYVFAMEPLAGVGVERILMIVALSGYYAATDGVLAALVSAVLPSEVRASGLAGVATCVAIGRLVTSIAFGFLWTIMPPAQLLPLCGAALALATTFAAFRLRLVSRQA